MPREDKDLPRSGQALHRPAGMHGCLRRPCERAEVQAGRDSSTQGQQCAGEAMSKRHTQLVADWSKQFDSCT